MSRERAWGSVFHVSGGDDAESLALSTGEVVPHMLHTWVVPLVCGVVWEDAFLAVA